MQEAGVDGMPARSSPTYTTVGRGTRTCGRALFVKRSIAVAIRPPPSLAARAAARRGPTARSATALPSLQTARTRPAPAEQPLHTVVTPGNSWIPRQPAVAFRIGRVMQQ